MASPSFCTNCGTPIRGHGNFCARCGVEVAESHAGAHGSSGTAPPVQEQTGGDDREQTAGTSGKRTSANAPQSVQSHPQPAPEAAITDAQDQEAVAVRATERPTGPPPVPPTPPIPSGPSGRTLALLAGAVAVGILVAIFGFFGSGSSEASTDPPPTTEPTATTAPETPEEPDPESKLRDLVPKEVGDFTLIEVDAVESELGRGATDALMATYRSSDGVVLVWSLTLWTTRERAEQESGRFGDYLADEKGYQLVNNTELKSEGGEVVGMLRLLRSEDREWLLWTIHSLDFSALSDHEHTLSFFKELNS